MGWEGLIWGRQRMIRRLLWRKRRRSEDMTCVCETFGKISISHYKLLRYLQLVFICCVKL
jgi:hypothetical protein